MRTNALVLVTAFAVTAIVAACGSDKPTGPQVTHFNAGLASVNERNADGTPKTISSNATGSAQFTLTGNTLAVVVAVSGLSGPATASHIHVGASNQNGAVVVPFTIASGVSNGTLVSQSFDLSTTIPGATITADSLMKLMNSGNAYVNVHTAANPAGEMRGQVVKQ
jgi:CHRD domain-containing protein